MQITLDKYTEIKEIKHTFSESLSMIREELDQHLDSINQNSMEISANYDYVEDLNKRIDKIEERLDSLAMMFNKNFNTSNNNISFNSKISLSREEKEIFLVLYTTQEPLSYEEIAHRTQLPCYLIEESISSLKLKGVPLLKRTFANKSLILLDDDFREEQAKYSVVDIKSSF